MTPERRARYRQEAARLLEHNKRTGVVVQCEKDNAALAAHRARVEG